MDAFEEFPIEPFGQNNASSMQEFLAEEEASKRFWKVNHSRRQESSANIDTDDEMIVGDSVVNERASTVSHDPGFWNEWQQRADIEVHDAIATALARELLRTLPATDGSNIERGSE